MQTCRRGDGLHPHGHFSLVGAAVACTTLHDFNRDEIRETINVASILPLATSQKAAELEEKFRLLAGAIVSPDALDETVAALQHIDAVDDVRDVTAVLRDK